MQYLDYFWATHEWTRLKRKRGSNLLNKKPVRNGDPLSKKCCLHQNFSPWFWDESHASGGCSDCCRVGLTGLPFPWGLSRGKKIFPPWPSSGGGGGKALWLISSAPRQQEWVCSFIYSVWHPCRNKLHGNKLGLIFLTRMCWWLTGSRIHCTYQKKQKQKKSCWASGDSVKILRIMVISNGERNTQRPHAGWTATSDWHISLAEEVKFVSRIERRGWVHSLFILCSVWTEERKKLVVSGAFQTQDIPEPFETMSLDTDSAATGEANAASFVSVARCLSLTSPCTFKVVASSTAMRIELHPGIGRWELGLNTLATRMNL